MSDTMTLEQSAPAGAPPAPAAPAIGPSDPTAAIRKAALLAGVALILVAGLAGFGNLIVMEGLVTPGNAARTAEDVLGSEGLFRLGVGSLYLAALLDVLVAWALFRVLGPVHKELARLAGWFRLTYAAVFLVAISQLAGIPQLLDGSAYAAAFTPEQLQGQVLLKVDSFHDIWSAGLTLFGIHLVVLGYLAYRSRFVPRAIGVLLVLAGAGYAFDSFVAVFTADPPLVASNVTFLGEFLLAAWLLLRGRRISPVGVGS